MPSANRQASFGWNVAGFQFLKLNENWWEQTPCSLYKADQIAATIKNKVEANNQYMQEKRAQEYLIDGSSFAFAPNKI